MQKAERDALIGRMSQEERQDYFRILQEWRSQIVADTSSRLSVRQLFEAQADTLPATVRQALAATVARDEMGPAAGTIPPDFELKRLDADERVRLSNFKGQRPVALAFGSYT